MTPLIGMQPYACERAISIASVKHASRLQFNLAGHAARLIVCESRALNLIENHNGLRNTMRARLAVCAHDSSAAMLRNNVDCEALSLGARACQA